MLSCSWAALDRKPQLESCCLQGRGRAFSNFFSLQQIMRSATDHVVVDASCRARRCGGAPRSGYGCTHHGCACRLKVQFIFYFLCTRRFGRFLNNCKNSIEKKLAEKQHESLQLPAQCVRPRVPVSMHEHHDDVQRNCSLAWQPRLHTMDGQLQCQRQCQRAV